MKHPNQKPIPEWILVVALILVAAGLYAPSLGYDFTGYDDDEYVTESPYVQRGLSVEMFTWAFTTGHAANWHPLTWISHAFDWQLAGPNPALHHATNVLLHALNAGLLFVLLKRCTGATWPSFAVAALFAIHPVNVESVAWIAERKNMLSTFFGILSLIAYGAYAKNRKRSAYVASCAALALGLMSKPMLVTWPFVMLLLDYWPLDRIKAPVLPLAPFVKDLRPLALEKVPFFLLVLASSITTYRIQSSGGAMGGVEFIPIVFRLGNAVVSYCNYVVVTFWPFGLAALYPHPLNALPVWKVLAAVIAMSTVTAAVLRFGRKERYLVTGWFFFLGTLVPVIGIVQVGSQAMADRYAYVPLLGLFIIAAWGVADIAARKKLPNRPIGAATAVVLVLLALRTGNQLPHWRNGITLWEHAVTVTENNYIAHNNLGSALLHGKGPEPERALLEFQESLKIRPTHPGALVNVGRMVLDQGKPADAAKWFEMALSVSPRHAPASYNLGVAYLQMRNVDKAFQQARLTQQITPEDPKVYNLLAIVSIEAKKTDDAVNYLETALRINPNYANAKSNLDRLLRERNSPK